MFYLQQYLILNFPEYFLDGAPTNEAESITTADETNRLNEQHMRNDCSNLKCIQSKTNKYVSIILDEQLFDILTKSTSRYLNCSIESTPT